MSLIDKALAAITPLPSEETRAQATREARALCAPGDWLSRVLDHHDLIRAAFEAGNSAQTAEERHSARRTLARVLNGHALAEELVLYPAMGQSGEKAHAAHAYLEQTTTKTQMAELETIAASRSAWKDKWKHIEGAVLTHMYEEESGWFLELHKSAPKPDRLTDRYMEEYSRYVDGA